MICAAQCVSPRTLSASASAARRRQPAGCGRWKAEPRGMISTFCERGWTAKLRPQPADRQNRSVMCDIDDPETSPFWSGGGRAVNKRRCKLFHRKGTMAWRRRRTVAVPPSSDPSRTGKRLQFASVEQQRTSARSKRRPPPGQNAHRAPQPFGQLRRPRGGAGGVEEWCGP
jgi:hypothetical protein